MEVYFYKPNSYTDYVPRQVDWDDLERYSEEGYKVIFNYFLHTYEIYPPENISWSKWQKFPGVENSE